VFNPRFTTGGKSGFERRRTADCRRKHPGGRPGGRPVVEVRQWPKTEGGVLMEFASDGRGIGLYSLTDMLKAPAYSSFAHIGGVEITSLHKGGMQERNMHF